MKKAIFTLVMMLSLSLSFAQQKNILVEELTGTWCQWCPGGIYYGDSLTQTYDNVIFVAIHCSDVMENGTYYNASGLTSAPSANIGRHFTGQNIGTWFSKVEQEMQNNPKASLEVTCDYNESTRELTATVTATALENMSGDYRLGAILTEDGITGPAPTYNQSNSYSGGSHGAMGGFENMPNPIPAERIAYDHVGRQLLSDYNGSEGSFPTSLAAGQTASYEFTYTLNTVYNYNYVRVIGILVAPDGTIDNAAQSLYLNGNDNAAPLFTSTEKTESYAYLNYIYNVYFHDSDDKDVTLTATTLPDWLTLEQYDNKSAALYGVPTEAGEYEVVLKISDGKDATEQAFTINVQEPLSGAWEYVGESGFSEVPMRTFGTCADSQHNIYVFGSENNIAVVYKHDNLGWSKLGNTNTSCGVSWNGIDIDSNDNIYIGFSESGASDAGHVMKWDGNTWSNVGNAFQGAEVSVHIDHNDVPYLLSRDVSQNYMGALFRLENNTWTPLSGTGIYAPSSQYGLWQTMTFDNQSAPYVAYADYMGGNAIHVVKFENGEWTEVGESVGSLYYYQDIAINSNNEVYLAYCNGGNGHKLSAAKFNGTAWENIGDDILGSSIEEMKACMVYDKFTVAALNTGQSNYLSVTQYDGEWNSVGPSVCSESSIDLPVITANGNTIVVAFKDEGQDGKTSCMQYLETIILYPPTDLTAEVFGNDNVELNWSMPVEGIPTGYNIYRDDALVETVTELTYSDYNIPAGTHRYTVSAVYPEGESVQAGPVVVEAILSIGENGEIHIYPTLVGEAFTIESQTDASMAIYNPCGQEMLRTNLVSGVNTIDVSSLPKGIYFISLSNGGFAKIVKQ